MRKYDFEKARRIVQERSAEIESASLGMHEDWFWTAEEIWNAADGFTPVLATERIGGIDASYWATPVLELTRKDGATETINCFVGEKEGDFTPLVGVMSAPAQALRSNIELKD